MAYINDPPLAGYTVATGALEDALRG